ncbi:MAG: SDR family oxidoreductase [Gammaproteobacteria bacterium]|nr:SDR family oxidoreductase [Gammaproteobacteria bacterium]MBQ0838539.1 SDR family oxidoreductase [Gammaproteobacteria bacterium]
MSEGNKLFGLDDIELIDQPTVYDKDLFKGKTVLISGGGTGIGRGIAVLYARLGASVVICGRRAEALEQTADLIRDNLGIEIRSHAMTIRDPQQVASLFDQVWDEFGRLDVLINNAGGQFGQDPIDYSVKGWNAVVDTNLNGTWYMMQTAARRWRDAGQAGNIINIVVNIHRGTLQATHSAAARAGVVYVSKSVAVEWAPLNIRVNCISPGAIASNGLRNYPREAAEKFKYANPMRLAGNVWDIAEACVYLGSGAGDFITGEVLSVDGGYQMLGEIWAQGEPDYFRQGRGASVK